MKTRIALAAIVALTALASPVRAETPSPAPAQGVDFGGFFRLGENYEAHRWSSYYALIGKNAGERQQSFHALAEKLGAQNEILADLDAYTKALQSFPYETSFNAWPEDVKKKWLSTPGYDWTKWKAWLDKPDFEPLFFFSLGRDSFTGSFAIGRSVLENNTAPSAFPVEVNRISANAGFYLTDTGYAKALKRLVPEAVEAIKVLATFKKFEDPLNETPISKDDVIKLSDACKTLTTLSHENKLVAPTPTSSSPQK